MRAREKYKSKIEREREREGQKEQKKKTCQSFWGPRGKGGISEGSLRPCRHLLKGGRGSRSFLLCIARLQTTNLKGK